MDFVIVRLDYQTLALKTHCALSQPLRKSLAPTGYWGFGDVFYAHEPANDFGYTRLVSRLTGREVLNASTVWSGRGGCEFPPDSMFQSTFEPGEVSRAPNSACYLSLFCSPKERADSAIAAALHTKVMAALAAKGPYEVVVMDHFYTVGMSDPRTAEWFVVAFDRPPAPPDVGVERVVWPRTVVQQGVATVPVIEVHNFGDARASFEAHLRPVGESAPPYASVRSVAALPADSSVELRFDALTPAAAGAMRLEFQLLASDGRPLDDAFADDDTSSVLIRSEALPIFRAAPSGTSPGCYPGWAGVGSVALDAYGDGRPDIIQLDYHPKLWRRGPDGSYHDVTDRISAALAPYPYDAVAEDFDRDGVMDLMLLYWDAPPVFLRGDGVGGFDDRSQSAGLTGFHAFGTVTIFDMNGDGAPDLIFARQGQEVLLHNDGHGHFTDVTAGSGINDPDQTERIAAGDVNGDGRPDLFFANWGAPSKLYLNASDGKFVLAPGDWGTLYARDASIADIDGDGRPDIVLARALYTDSTSLYRNLDGVHFAEPSPPRRLPPAFSVTTGSLLGGDRPDVLLGLSDPGSGGGLFTWGDGGFVDESALLVETYLRAKTQILDLDQDGRLDIYTGGAALIRNGGDLAQPIPPAPSRNALLAPSPNPFSPAHGATWVSWELAGAGRVRVEVYDVCGRRLRVLMDGVRPAGNGGIGWDGRDSGGRRSGTGVYFVAMEAPGYRGTRKLLLLN
ncbi:MAG TPA: FG-GAP-like repeat-containing protein [Candidatus Saccharimonadales bacterium]|nr:FG-GAP-like repeat-containing protein [Candidatus Saccharimonadales bacterium]